MATTGILGVFLKFNKRHKLSISKNFQTTCTRKNRNIKLLMDSKTLTKTL